MVVEDRLDIDLLRLFQRWGGLGALGDFASGRDLLRRFGWRGRLVTEDRILDSTENAHVTLLG